MAGEKKRSELRVGLLWHSSNSGNLGVGALTVANILLASRAAERANLQPKFTTIGYRDKAVEYVDVDSLRIDGRTLLNPRGYWRELATFDCLLDIGGGDSFTDIYGPKRFGYLWLTKALAIGKGKPLLLSPQTIGPFSGQPYRKLAGSLLRRADAVFARDRMSMAAIQELAPAARAFQSVDVAFALPYTPAERSSDRVRIGLNVSGLLFNNTLEKTAKGALSYDYAEFARRLVKSLTADPRNQVELICHVSAPEQPNDDDGAVADLLAREHPGLVRVPTFASPSDAKSYISGLDFLIAGRMHACIAAYSAKVPFVATAYSRKFSGLFGMLEYPAVLSNKGVAIEEALKFVSDALASRDQLRNAIDIGMDKIDHLLGTYETELTAFFLHAARKPAS
jgi:polysaccharide pyruvyl transferase WcaK-like protein